MTIDGCDRTFEDLANHILPGYMDTLRAAMSSPLPMKLFSTPGLGVKGILGRLGLAEDVRGCYVLMEEDRAVYVGISGRLIQRLYEHVRGTDHLSATLAYRIAAMEHPHGTKAATAMKDPVFHQQFEDTRERLKSFTVAYAEIENPLELYVFEAYCAMELDTGFDANGWNTFVTH